MIMDMLIFTLGILIGIAVVLFEINWSLRDE